MCHGHTFLSKAADRQKRREGIKIGLFAVFFYSKLFSSRKKDKAMTLYELREVFAALVLPACVFGRQSDFLCKKWERNAAHSQQKRSEYTQRFTRVSLLARLFVAFRVIGALEEAWLISVALLRGNRCHFFHPPRKN